LAPDFRCTAPAGFRVLHVKLEGLSLERLEVREIEIVLLFASWPT